MVATVARWVRRQRVADEERRASGQGREPAEWWCERHRLRSTWWPCCDTAVVTVWREGTGEQAPE